MNCLGKITADPNAALFDREPEFVRFVSPLGVDGLVKVRLPRLDILAIGSSHPGSGQFRRFIVQAKTEFDTICVWEVWNPLLKAVLPRYGFVPATDFFEGSQVSGFRWDKSNP